MFYEERMIDGLLCYRSRPDAEWRPISTQELSRRAAQVAELVKALRELVADVQPPALAAEGQIRAPKRKTLENAKAALAAAESEAAND